MADVFISYAGEDRATASALSSALEACGWSVWWDRGLVAGESFAGTIQTELDRAGCVVVLWSQAAAKSQWVTAESQRAFDAGKVLPVLLDNWALPLPISSVQAPGLAGWDRTSGAPELQELIDAINTKIDPSKLVATAPGPLFRCVAIGDWGCAAAGHDGVIRVWALDDGRVLREFTGHRDLTTAVAWDGSDRLVSGGVDRTARVWALNDGVPVRVLEGHGGPVDDVVVRGDQVVTVSSDQTVRWWSIETGLPLASHAAPSSLLSCAADGTGRLVAAGGTDGSITLLLDHAVVAVVEQAHRGLVYALRLSTDGTRLLSTGADGLAKLWSTSDRTELATYRGHRGPVLCGALGEDIVVTGSTDGTIRTWVADSGQQLGQIAGMVGGTVGIDLSVDGIVVATGANGQIRSTEPGVQKTEAGGS